jgi:hypothetical protein
VAKLIGSLDIEERARAKDMHGKDVESSSANIVQKKISNASRNKKKRTSKRTTRSLNKQPLLRRKRTTLLFCGSDEHWASSCLERKFKQEKKSTNIVVSEAKGGISGYDNYLPTVFSVCHSPEWWMDTGANIHVSTDASLFSSYLVNRTGALLMENGSHAHVLGVDTVILKFTSRKTVLLKNVQHVPSIKKNLVSSSQCCRDGYKMVFKSNKCVLSNYGTFVGKGYDYRGLFYLSLHDDVCNKIVNNAIIPDESNILQI